MPAYPVSPYRKGSPRAPGRRGPQTPPRRHAPRGFPKPPGGMPKLPPAARPAAGLSAAFAGRLAGKVAARLVPGLGLALAGWELYSYLREQVDPAGWYLAPGSCARVGDRWKSGTGNYSCSSESAFTTSTLNSYTAAPEFTTWPSAHNISYGRPHPTVANYHWVNMGQIWRRKVANTNNIPFWVKKPQIYYAPNPLARPVPREKPAPDTFPRPRSFPRAVAPPGTQPASKPQPEPGPRTRPDRRARPRPRRRNPRPQRIHIPLQPFPVVIAPPVVFRPDDPRPLPLQPPTVTIGGPPGAPPVTVRPGNPKDRPPDPKTVERKVNVRSRLGGAWLAMNFVTEGADLVDSLWRSLDPAVRSKGRPTPQQKLRDLYDNWLTMDVAAAVTAYLNNEIEDRLYGRLAQPVKRLQQQGNITTGLSRALDQARKAHGDDGVPLPELTYNRDTGEWGYKWGSVAGTFGKTNANNFKLNPK